MNHDKAKQIVFELGSRDDLSVSWNCADQTAEFRYHNDLSDSRHFPSALLSGSFNPIHDGHREMARKASQLLGVHVSFELPIVNADKPPIDATELAQRVSHFRENETLWLTRMPTFEQKATLFSPVWFVVGIDTIERIAELRFYEGDAHRQQKVFLQWEALEVRFLVFGRSDTKSFRTLDDVELPESLHRLCRGVSRSEFDVNVSSSQIRDRR